MTNQKASAQLTNMDCSPGSRSAGATTSSVAPLNNAAELSRGVSRLLAQMGFSTLTEFKLGNGRRADLAGLDRTGQLVLVELKVSRSDLCGDSKWPTYLEYCDALYFGVPAGFDLELLASEAFMPERTGLMVGDGYGAAMIRPAKVQKLSAARRKAETLRFGRRAADRLQAVHDPQMAQQMTPVGQMLL